MFKRIKKRINHNQQLMQQLNIPIKKSKKQIESYLKHGKYFGNILKEIYDTLIIDNILKTSRDIELYFKELSEKYDPMVDYPFRDQINQEGKRFKAPICVSINDSVAHSRPKSTIKLKQNGTSISGNSRSAERIME